MSKSGDAAAIRKKIDAGEAFGHQIIKPLNRERKIPEWAQSDEQVQIILQRSFPKLKTNPKQRQRAGRWARIIQLFYRSKMTGTHVAEELGISYHRFENLLCAIKRAANGKRANGSGARTRNVCEVVQTDSGGFEIRKGDERAENSTLLR